jgi:hypothetical protein
MSNLGGMPLGSVVVFSSIAGRFGNAAQTDYSAANDLLCKHISSFRNRPVATRGIAIDWTAWGGIGMASRGSIPAIMERAGIDMLPSEVGVPVVRRELSAGSGTGEVVVAGSLGIMAEEFDETGGLDPPRVSGTGIMTGRVVGMGLHSGLIVETELDPGEQPFLYDHQIDGTPVLPGVMGIEAMAEAATLLYPERVVGSVEDVHFEVPFKFYRGEARTVTVRVSLGTEGDSIIADCRLEGSRALHGRSRPEVTSHFRSRVRLIAEAPDETERREIDVESAATKLQASDIYKVYFHGPAYQVVETSWRHGDELIGLYAGNLPANHIPAERATVVEPRWIELCFQTAGILELAEQSRMGLPYRIREVKIHQPLETVRGRVIAAVTSGRDGTFQAQLLDERGDVTMTVSGYQTMALPEAVASDLLEPLKEAIELS